MPFPDASFDLLVANLGINNFPDPRAALRECRRVAKGGARIVLTTNVQGHFGALYVLLDDILGGLGLKAARDALHREAAHRLSLDAIARLLEGSRFAVSRSLENRFRMRFADGSALLRHSLVQWFLDGWRRAVGEANEREVFDRLELRLNAIASSEGGVAMTVPMLYVEAVAV
jgi:SAM-dependent methyltransferase